MKTNQRKPLIGIVGIILVMVTAASVSAADQRVPLAQEDTGTAASSEGSAEPLLIATADNASNGTLDIPDYGNYTGDMLISPGPQAKAETSAIFGVPLLGILGAAAAIALVGVGIVIVRRRKK